MWVSRIDREWSRSGRHPATNGRVPSAQYATEGPPVGITRGQCAVSRRTRRPRARTSAPPLSGGRSRLDRLGAPAGRRSLRDPTRGRALDSPGVKPTRIRPAVSAVLRKLWTVPRGTVCPPCSPVNPASGSALRALTGLRAPGRRHLSGQAARVFGGALRTGCPSSEVT